MMDGSLSGLGPKMTSTFGRQNLVLAGFLNRSTKSMGFGLAAQPVLALPGWYVVPKGIGAVTVLNHKQLCAAIARGEDNVLTLQQN